MRITDFNINKHRQRRDKCKRRAMEALILGMDEATAMMAMNYAVKKQSSIRKIKMRTRQLIAAFQTEQLFGQGLLARLSLQAD